MDQGLEQALRSNLSALTKSLLEGDRKKSAKQILTIAGGAMGAQFLGPWGVVIGGIVAERAVDSILADNGNTAIFRSELKSLEEQERLKRIIVDAFSAELTKGVAGSVNPKPLPGEIEASRERLALVEVECGLSEDLLTAIRTVEDFGISLTTAEAMWGIEDRKRVEVCECLYKKARQLAASGQEKERVSLMLAAGHFTFWRAPTESLRIHKELRDGGAEGYPVHMSVAHLERRLGNYQAALAASIDAQMLARGPGQIAMALSTSASLFTVLGEHSQALRSADGAQKLVGEGRYPFVRMQAAGAWAEASVGAGKIAASVSAFRKAIRLCENHRDRVGAEFWRLGLSNAFRLLGRLDEASAAAHSAFKVFHAEGASFGACLANERLGLIEMERGRAGEATEYYRTAQRLARGRGWHELELSILGNIGNSLRREGDLPGARAAIDEALDTARDSGNRFAVARQLKASGDIFLNTRELPEAKRCYSEALALLKDSGSKEGRAALYVGLGTVAFWERKLEDARNSFEEALALNEEMRLTSGIAAVRGNLSQVFEANGEIASAIEECEKAVCLFSDLENFQAQVEHRRRLAVLHADSGQAGVAEKMLERLLEDVERKGRADLLGPCWVSLGRVRLELGDEMRSFVDYEKARDSFANVGNSHQATAQDLNLALLDCRAERFGDAILRAENALGVFSELGDTSGKESARRLLVQIGNHVAGGKKTPGDSG